MYQLVPENIGIASCDADILALWLLSHPIVKTTFLILNTIFGIALMLLLMTMIDKREQAEIVIDSPVFFSDLVFILVVSIGPILIAGGIFTALRSELQASLFPMMLLVLALLSGVAAYNCIPSVRQERLLQKTIDTKHQIDDLKENVHSYRDHQEYYQHRMQELRVFHDWFEGQYTFLVNADRIKDKRADRLSTFFALLSGLLGVDAVWVFIRNRGGKTTKDLPS